MYNIFKKVLTIICCVLSINSLVFSSQIVICKFNSELNFELLHNPKIAHNHDNETHFHLDFEHSECHSQFDSEGSDSCHSCSDTEILHKNFFFKKSQLTPNYSSNYDITDKYLLETKPKPVLYFELNQNSSYIPSLTVLRI